MKMTETERDQNLMIVYAVEGYAHNNDMSEYDAFLLFQKHGVNELIRKNYNALHTQGFEEGISFAEDVLSWKKD